MKPQRISSLTCVSALSTASLICAAAFFTSIQSSSAISVVSLTDANSVAQVDLDGGAGMFSWSVDGQNQLNQQWFYYRVGGAVAQPINAIGPAVISYQTANTVVASYANAQFSLDITYILTGGGFGSGSADILETITVNNFSGAALDFHFFQYSDFDLGGTPGGDSVSITSSGGGYDYVLQYKGPLQIGESINQPPADRAETDEAFNTLNRLTSIAGYDLNNVDSYGPGNATWALQWDVLIADGGNFDVFKDKKLSITPIPEPSVLAIFALGAGLASFVSRRRNV